MIIQIGFYSILCNSCDWSINWFDYNDPWKHNVSCPYHPGHKQVDGRNRPDDPARYLPGLIQYVDQHEEAYGSIKLVLYSKEREQYIAVRTEYQPPQLP